MSVTYFKVAYNAAENPLNGSNCMNLANDRMPLETNNKWMLMTIKNKKCMENLKKIYNKQLTELEENFIK